MILGGWPFPLDLRARSPRLKWFHQRPAGASNLRIGDLWGSDVAVTTSRGVGSTLAMAEYAIAGILHFAKEPGPRRARSRGGRVRPSRLPAAAAGGQDRVRGRRRRDRARGRPAGRRPRHARHRHAAPAGSGCRCRRGSPCSAGTDDLDRFLAESDFVAICCQWTPETTKLINATRLAAMKPGVVLVNVARGEIMDEAALAEALSRGHLRGVVLDVYVGEFERLPPETLWRDPRVLITPHTSGHSDENRHGAIELFCENLRAYLDGAPLRNVIDWGARLLALANGYVRACNASLMRRRCMIAP